MKTNCLFTLLLAMLVSSCSGTQLETEEHSEEKLASIVNVKVTVPKGSENASFYKIKLIAESDIFPSSTTYSVDEYAFIDEPSFDRRACCSITYSFGKSGIKPTAGVINARMMMLPAQWKGKTISVKLYGSKNNVPTLSGTFTPDSHLIAGDEYGYSVQSRAAGQILPDKPEAGEQLHILLFGHSFGTDCMQYLPAITKAAGITDAHFARFYQSNCSLQAHWGHIVDKDAYDFYSSSPSTGAWTARSSKAVDEVLAQYPWDIIVFQQEIGFNGEGNYSSYQPYLNNLADYVTEYCETAHGKTPVIGWHMFWGYNKDKSTAYDVGTNGAFEMYKAIVKATKDMVADNTKAAEINIIVPTGTAIQNARGTSLNDPGSSASPSTTMLLTRDGVHASDGIGRYTAACTWFEYLIAPIYGASIKGNSFRPTYQSFEKDVVNDERAAICWKCAIEAVNQPYEVTRITE